MIDAVISTLIGGLLALAGALVGPFFQRRHERWQASRSDQEKLRLKAEELFDELDKLNQNCYASTMSVIKVAKGEPVEILPVPDLGKVRAIVAVYFPSAQSIVDEFEKERVRTSNVFLEYFKEKIPKGGVNDHEVRQMQAVMMTNHQKIISDISKDLRNHLSAVVPRLK